jgi:peroxiredoxin
MRIISEMTLLILLFVGNSVIAQDKSTDSGTLVSTGMQVPVFKYEYEKGKIASIADSKGKIVLINFFATWCGPCKMELPKIQSEIWEKHKDSPKFVMLTFGREHSWKEVDKFRSDNKFPFTMFPDPKRAVYGQFAKQLIPRSFLLDENGKIIYLSEGYEEKHFEELVKLIDSKL